MPSPHSAGAPGVHLRHVTGGCGGTSRGNRAWAPQGGAEAGSAGRGRLHPCSQPLPLPLLPSLSPPLAPAPSSTSDHHRGPRVLFLLGFTASAMMVPPTGWSLGQLTRKWTLLSQRYPQAPWATAAAVSAPQAFVCQSTLVP